MSNVRGKKNGVPPPPAPRPPSDNPYDEFRKTDEEYQEELKLSN
jgi:hypothetical protein